MEFILYIGMYFANVDTGMVVTDTIEIHSYETLQDCEDVRIRSSQNIFQQHSQLIWASQDLTPIEMVSECMESPVE